MQDKFSATWVSHSSISDFLKCRRLYYLRNVYKDPKTNHKVNIISPSLALGQSVHEVLEALSLLPAEERFSKSLHETYDEVWQKVTGRMGGFSDIYEEEEFKERGRKMLQRVLDKPGPILNKAIKIQKDLPNYYLSVEDNIILCGKVDWLEYLPESDSVHVIDFKTGKHEENADSLQLPIYHLIVKNCQKRNVSKASYWYLDSSDVLHEVTLPSLDVAYDKVIEIAKKVKEARTLKEFDCIKKGCRDCYPFEAIIKGAAEFVGVGGYKQDLYILR
jgi:ATP-dependent helicase/DNAse subunit B